MACHEANSLIGIESVGLSLPQTSQDQLRANHKIKFEEVLSDFVKQKRNNYRYWNRDLIETKIRSIEKNDVPNEKDYHARVSYRVIDIMGKKRLQVPKNSNKEQEQE